ncbi:MAG: DUF6894 family protein [Janthinobacterium lividum]
MPTYFFDIIDNGTLAVDQFGDELADDAEARTQAIALLPTLVRDELPDGDRHEFATKARNQSGKVVYETSLIFQGRWWPESD